jgi:uncharacterized protein
VAAGRPRKRGCRPGRGRDRLQRLVEKRRRIPQAGGMKLERIIALLLALALLAGCKKPESAAGTPAVDDRVPKHAQAKLPTVRIYLGAEQLDAELALTDEQQRTGMMFRTNLLETDAMIFVFAVPQRASFWMKNCPESLSAAYIGPDGIIEEIHHFEKQDENPVTAGTDNIQYVLEVKDGWFLRHNVSTGAVIRTDKGSLPETFFKK